MISISSDYGQLWSKPFKGCLIALLVILLGFIWLFLYVLKIPTIERIGNCRENILIVGRAIELYKSKYKEYPNSLSDIKDEFLKDKSVVGCQDAKGNFDEFLYHKPSFESPDDFIVLEKDMGENIKGIKIGRMVYLKSGVVSMRPSNE
ncbi:MAG: hypothetical protein SNJ70_09900 [Armatimonadota bacterium]